MKLSTITVTATAVLALAACNNAVETNNAADANTVNAVEETTPDANAVDANAAKPEDGAVGGNDAAPAGDKPEGDASAGDSADAGGDKPTE